MQMTNPQIQSFFDDATWTFTHVVYDRIGGSAAVIDSVLDYDPKSGRTSTNSIERVITFLREQQLTLEWILETHAHADHLSASHYLQENCGGKIAIGQHIDHVQGVFKKVFHLEPEFAVDGSQCDVLFDDDEVFLVGSLQIKALHVPGHTSADLAYQVGDAVFVGDTLFMPDVGTARCDFPGGDARTLFASVQKLLALPPQTRLFMCHDYPPAAAGAASARAPQCQTSVAAQRTHNIHVHSGMSEQDFVELRTQRDATLSMPVLILPSVQVNIRAGQLPPAERNGTRYLKIPLNVL